MAIMAILTDQNDWSSTPLVIVGMAIALWFGLGEIGWLFHFSE